MKKQLARTEHYSIDIDSSKNRAYFALSGFIKSPSDIPHLLSDVSLAAKGLKTGFTLLADLTAAKPVSAEASEVLLRSQQTWIQSGMAKAAEVSPGATVKMAADRIGKDSGMKRIAFATIAEAEKWLDQP
jgi:hypothetical protein